ncbi:MAG: SUMF1/EgtB/PvdO family nonheme iron enzyme [Proteobacteria bacterium]|nr:SUMF1/EgtB/PvdO family nonheme iron enzyme [Pseudomonadota bacterium]
MNRRVPDVVAIGSVAVMLFALVGLQSSQSHAQSVCQEGCNPSPRTCDRKCSKTQVRHPETQCCVAKCCVAKCCVPKPSPPRTGSLYVRANVEGARIYLNGRDRGRAPKKITGLKPGKYVLRVQKGTALWQGDVWIKRGRTTTKRAEVAEPGLGKSLGIVHTALKDIAPMRFVGLTGGRFTMGSPAREKGRDKDETEHVVTVSGFEIAEAEVTKKQWATVMGRDPSWKFGNSGNTDNHPVQNINWYDAIEFVNKLSRREKLSECYAVNGTGVTRRASCTGYRLPTEAEWEYACRAGSQTAYGQGVDESALSRYARYGKGLDDGTVTVKSLKPNAWGLYGMHGNVWEWVWDRYAAYLTSAQTDPVGPPSGQHRSLRGGSFFWAEGLRCANRFWNGPGDRFRFIGLRVVRRARRQP